ncbi:ABC transporter permease, partial [Streptomyces polyrhachis]
MLGAAALTVLLAVVVLTALVALTEHAAQTGARQRLAAAPDATVRVSGRYDPAGLRAADPPVRAALDGVFGPVEHQVQPLLRAPAADTRQLPAAGDTMWLTLLGVADPASHARLTEGRWPRTAAGPGAKTVEAAFDRDYAARFGLRPGSRVAAGRLTLQVSGLYTRRAAQGPLWNGMTGTFGLPDSIVLLAPGSFAAAPPLAADAAALWIATPDSRRLTLDQIGPLRERIPAFAASRTDLSVFGGAPPPLREVAVKTQLSYELGQLDVPVAVARAGMYLPAALLAALAAAPGASTSTTPRSGGSCSS